MWINNGCSAERIYTGLLIHFNKRPSPEDAKMKLYTYRASKNEDLAKAQGRIELLVRTESKAVPAGASRVAYIDLEGYQALSRALPEWSSIQVSNLYKQLSAKGGRNLAFNELDQALHALRANINLDIAQNGVEVHCPNTFQLQKFSSGRFCSYAMDANRNIDTFANGTFPIQKTRTETSFTPSILTRPSGESLDDRLSLVILLIRPVIILQCQLIKPQEAVPLVNLILNPLEDWTGLILGTGATILENSIG
jgi:hypothetical protein